MTKLTRIFDKYRALLKKRLSNSAHKKLIGKGNITKNRILNFYLKNNRWPSRRSKDKVEKILGIRFENYISKEAQAYDSTFRRIAMATGRKTNGKRKHDVKGFKKEILAFVETHGRVPARYRSAQMIKGEATLRAKLDYYTLKRNDMTLLGSIYEIDKCHKSAIPMRYRPLINKNLNTETPLVRMSNKALEE